MNRNTRTVVVLLIAIATAGAATFLVNRAIQQRPVQQVEVPQVQIVVASRSLVTGTQLTTKDVKLVGWPGTAIVPGSFTKVEDVVNRGVLVEVAENEPLTGTKLAAVGAGAGLPPTITPGMRAISVRVNEVVGVAGFVTPGNRVDVFVTLNRGEASITKIVVSNVQVLTAGTKYEQDKSRSGEAMPSSVVTLLLSPEDAERVVLAATEGLVMLALRNPLDVEPTRTAGTRLAALYGSPDAPVPAATPRVAVRPKVVAPPPLPPPPPPPPEPKPYTVETIRGARRSQEEVR